MELGKGYTQTNLRYFRQFYIFANHHTTCDTLSWSHYRIMLSIKDINEINYYIKITESQNLSVRELREKIKNKEYERLDNRTKEKLIKKEEIVVSDFIKNPILIKNSHDYEDISEKVLQKLILEEIDNFLEELGEGFTYIKNEYKIKVGDRYNYIDLLLFNYVYNCFIVVGLKVTKLKKEYIGQIETYMHYIDNNLKRLEQNKTIGIIIVRKDNKFIMEYCSDKRILTRVYNLV